MSLIDPNGIDPNSIDTPEFTGDRAIIYIYVFIGIQILAVALRFWARALTLRSWGWDDWLVGASLLSTIVYGAASISGIKQGAVGYHYGYLEETNPEAITIFFKYLLALSTWFYATNGLSRLAVCVLYYHLFPQRPTVIAINIIVCTLVCLAASTVTTALAACHPFSAAWAEPEVQAVHCINREALFLWSTFPSIFIDFALLTLPIPIIWRLATTVQLKIGLTVTFLIGSLGLIATILRFVAFFMSHSLGDPTFVAVDLIVWTMAEPGIGLISACIIMYRPLLKKLNGCFQNRSNISSSTNTWPATYGSRSISGHHVLRRVLDDGERGIALRNESSLEQILDSDGRSHRGHNDTPMDGRPF